LPPADVTGAAIRTPSPEQRRAADPANSVWVNANAGSGKTAVLVDRVVRLLLTGADPTRILCVTFTKAAAANMQDRIFQRLGQWVAMEDGALAQELHALTGEAPRQNSLASARRLFARAVETPGGLKIQTIHALCERLLHLFPFEAAVPARFEMFDDAAAAAAMARALQGTLAAALGEGAELAEALRIATDSAGEDGVRAGLEAFVRLRRKTARSAPESKRAVSALRRSLGLQPGETAEQISRAILEHGLYAGDWRAIETWLRSSGKDRDEDMADFLKAGAGEQGARDLESYLRVFLTKDFKARADKGWFVSSDLRKTNARLLNVMTEERERVVKAYGWLKAAAAAERTEAIARLADAALARYEAEKRRLGKLDFDDLIGKARDLLVSDASRWVLWKLDQGVDHVLVDEAQDTSPPQWDIVKAITDDFFSGEGGRDGARRTVFAVGDEKQSIFGFQGAEPAAFTATRRHFSRRIAELNAESEGAHMFDEQVRLEISFRTTKDVLDAVDHVFSLPEHYAGLESEARKTIHETNRTREPGLVEFWAPEEPPPKADADADPTAPLDARSAAAATVRLAERIARRIRFWIDSGARFEATGKRITAGDVLILVRSRSPVFEDVIDALKKHKVPVAGADRMTLTRQIAVMDLLSLGRFCVLEEDDLALAEVLKSPLCGLTDAELEAIAVRRDGESLWAALQARAEGIPAAAEAVRMLTHWRKLAAAVDPFKFYATVLSADGQRRRLLARLGPDTAEAIDVFLYRLRQWQAANPPSLRLFVEAMAGDASDVKRDMEDAHGRVRVMTVHASKGLEAPIVFLIDLYKSASGGGSQQLIEAVPGEPETAVWTPRKDDDPPVLEAGRGHVARLQEEEHRRLLYVAMTRARDRLYVAGAKPARSNGGVTWAQMIDTAMEGRAEIAEAMDEAGEGAVRRWRTVLDPPRAPVDEKGEARASELFPWLHSPAPNGLPRPPPLRPSRLSDAAEPPPAGDFAVDRSARRLRGDLMHLLLQHLPNVPDERRANVGAALARARYGGLPPDMREEALSAVMALLDDSRWAALLGRNARVEVEIAGRIPIDGRSVEVAGRIDRLLVGEDTVTILDYKTGRAPADPAATAESHLRQMAVYRALVRDLHPGRPVRTAILWTSVPAIAVIPDARLDAALARIGAPTAVSV
jgi:ATP-dependent helicase/nuclease subunit A